MSGPLFYSRVKETTTTQGVGTLTLAGAVADFRSFSLVGDGNTCYYTIDDGSSNFEVGIGTYHTGGTLSRTTVQESSNANAAVNFGAGSKNVWLDVPASWFTASGTVAGGGTGAVTLASNGVLYGAGTSSVQALAVNSTATNKFLTQSSSAAPAWATLVTGDLPANGANPSASVGLSAVNGSATTWMRSDGAPALEVTIAPSWSGAHTFTNKSAVTITQAVIATAAPSTPLTVTTGAHTSLTAGNNFIAGSFDALTNQPQWATGTLASLTPWVFKGVKPKFVGASTVTAYSTVDINSAGDATGTNCSGITANYYLTCGGTSAPVFGVGVPSGASATSNFLSVTGTLPSSLSSNTNANYINITGAGSSGQNVRGFFIELQAGWTGNQSSSGFGTRNYSAGTGNGGPYGWFSSVANYGGHGGAEGTTTGTNVGVSGYAFGGNINCGLSGSAVTAKNSATNIGVAGFGLNTGTTPIQVGGFFGLMGSGVTFASAALMCDNGSQASDIFVARDNGTAKFVIADGGLVGTYNGVATAALGLGAIVAQGRVTAQTAAVSSVCAFTPAADGTFEISANVLVTTATLHNFTVECAYTDEGNTARVLTLPFQVLAGTSVASITNAQGAVPYEGQVLEIRAKGGTSITLRTQAAGTYTTVTFNFQGTIKQTAS